jgi:CubicO group peptidase (beta-lactamase class C family)
MARLLKVGLPFVLLLCNSLCGTSSAQVAGAQGKIIDNYLQRLSGFGYSGTVLVSVNGKIILRKGYGFANREEHILNQPETVFDIGSLAKNLSAAAILRLEADGKLQVEDPISKFLLDLPADKQSITVHQLLTHTSGVTGPEHGYQVIDKREAIRGIVAAPLKFKPGSKWEYSNAGYILLAAVIESASGESYQEYMVRNIFRPAGMSSTGFWGAKLPHSPSRLIAKGYDELSVVADPQKLSGDTWNDMGGGQIVSTVDDLYRWQQSLEHNRVLPRTGLKKMLTPVMTDAPSDTYFTNSYGCGIWAQTLPDGTHRFHHGGDFLGFSSQMTWLPERKTVITALCNVRIELYPVHRRADRTIPEILAGAKVPEPPSYIELPAPELNRFAGTYTLPTGGQLTLYRSPGGLAIGGDGQDATILLDGNYDQEDRLTATGEATGRLLTSLLRRENSSLAAVGLGDLDTQHDIRRELDSLGNGLGAFKKVSVVGTYVGGLLGKFNETLLKVEFERGNEYYRVQWNGKEVAGTDLRCPHLAASTLLQPRSAFELVGWNIITLKEFSLRFDPTFRSITVRSGSRRAIAQRLYCGESVPHLKDWQLLR